MSFGNMLTQTCTISRDGSSTADAYGHSAVSWADLATSVRCRVCETYSGSQEREAPAEVVIEHVYIYLPAGQDVTESDRIVVDSRTYDVEHVLSARDGAGIVRHVRTTCKVVR